MWCQVWLRRLVFTATGPPSALWPAVDCVRGRAPGTVDAVVQASAIRHDSDVSTVPFRTLVVDTVSVTDHEVAGKCCHGVVDALPVVDWIEACRWRRLRWRQRTRVTVLPAGA